MINDLVVIGGGAAGFFAAINAAMLNPKLKIIILEKSPKVLQKVKISGGGRCNVTNIISKPQELIKNYPRGEKFLENPFNEFTSKDTVSWFKNQGVDLKVEKDGRIFPVSNSSQTIIDCFLDLCKKYSIIIEVSTDVKSFQQSDNLWTVKTSENGFLTKNILVATGSSPAFLKNLAENSFEIANAVPSLFTFTVGNKEICQLSGLSVSDAKVGILGSGSAKTGPLLITHWGFSGPAVLKLSSHAAVILNDLNYDFILCVNWINRSSTQINESLKNLSSEAGKRNVISHNPFDLPSRLWKFLCNKAEIREFQNWAECGKKQFNNLTAVLSNDTYKVVGKSTNKDEFVTAGGVEMAEINLSTYESISHKGLFFAGEVLNTDGYTGGFNFQAAWTSGFLVAKAISSEKIPLDKFIALINVTSNHS